ncbi:MAG: hypothetical protein QNJ29_15015 [Rhizobiaceae bacterium]|nr:hypothetical protein [Rhizobiaceae bacterium]
MKDNQNRDTFATAIENVLVYTPSTGFAVFAPQIGFTRNSYFSWINMTRQ